MIIYILYTLWDIIYILCTYVKYIVHIVYSIHFYVFMGNSSRAQTDPCSFLWSRISTRWNSIDNSNPAFPAILRCISLLYEYGNAHIELRTSLWLWLTVCELEAMAHRNRWFTELKDGDFPKNDGVCQLGWWMKFPTEWKVIKGIKAMFQTTNQPLPSGKHTKSDRKSPCSMGKSTVSMAIFNSKLLVYQRVIVTTKSWGALFSDHLPSGYFT